jgi:curved DNA-binding protein CbpA
MFPRNCYAVLRIPEDADPAVIRHAYRTLVRRFHPDAGIGSSAQKFREVTEAYDVLSDPERRQDHDVDLARSRASFRVRPELLIPETPRHIRPSAFGIDQEFVRMFQMMEEMLRQIW